MAKGNGKKKAAAKHQRFNVAMQRDSEWVLALLRAGKLGCETEGGIPTDRAVRQAVSALGVRERNTKQQEQAWIRGFNAYRDAQREEVWFQDNERTVLCQKCGSPVVFIVRGAPEPKR